jgi:hypothetical protein
MPVVFEFAAAGLLAWRGRTLTAGTARRAAAAALALLLLLCLVPSFRMNLGHPAFGFVDQAEPAVQERPTP